MKRKQKGVNLISAACMCTLMSIPMSVISPSYAADIKVTKEETKEHEAYFKGSSSDESQHYLGGEINSTWGYKYIAGTKPILITVPHSVNQEARDGYRFEP